MREQPKDEHCHDDDGWDSTALYWQPALGMQMHEAHPAFIQAIADRSGIKLYRSLVFRPPGETIGSIEFAMDSSLSGACVVFRQQILSLPTLEVAEDKVTSPTWLVVPRDPDDALDVVFDYLDTIGTFDEFRRK